MTPLAHHLRAAMHAYELCRSPHHPLCQFECNHYEDYDPKSKPLLVYSICFMKNENIRLKKTKELYYNKQVGEERKNRKKERRRKKKGIYRRRLKNSK